MYVYVLSPNAHSICRPLGGAGYVNKTLHFRCIFGQTFGSPKTTPKVNKLFSKLFVKLSLARFY